MSDSDVAKIYISEIDIKDIWKSCHWYFRNKFQRHLKILSRKLLPAHWLMDWDDWKFKSSLNTVRHKIKGTWLDKVASSTSSIPSQVQMSPPVFSSCKEQLCITLLPAVFYSPDLSLSGFFDCSNFGFLLEMLKVKTGLGLNWPDEMSKKDLKHQLIH